jgi:hypothetical protein
VASLAPDLVQDPIERGHKEVKRLTDVVCAFPTHDSVLRVAGALLAEQPDKWQTSDCCCLTMNRTTVLDVEQPIRLELEDE